MSWHFSRPRVHIARALGVVGVGCAAIAIIPVVVIPFVALGDGPAEYSLLPPPLRRHIVATWLVAALVVAATPLFGRMTAYGQRKVLFLRRFGSSEATAFISTAVEELGGRWRVVALDDDVLRPVGTTVALRRTAAVAHRLGQVSSWLAGAGHLLLNWLTGAVTPLVVAIALIGITRTGSLDERLQQVWGYDGLGSWLFWGYVYVAVAFPAILLLLIFPLMLLCLVVTPAVAYCAPILSRIRHANSDGLAVAVPDLANVQVVGTYIDKKLSGMASPRLLILAVNGAVWQEAVLAAAKACDVALIDVSDFSVNVAWELGTLRKLGIRVVTTCCHGATNLPGIDTRVDFGLDILWYPRDGELTKAFLKDLDSALLEASPG